ncbi:carbohydrate esterase family 1 protein [Schizophyllum commune H4-8]|uniref:feruloyl esterase n=1 Tax=Schizophyllum commune (strain H4-8 / FGSC 9210) TaxID=578458 RepID=D8Q6C5_SCHCM|nr:carbohydrate esterase family 1 protein [Schizophyllum commune H4-8]KAI5891007.1 carbohydrate esterase family 1 protein [Schizophyllum commune H4-8]
MVSASCSTRRSAPAAALVLASLLSLLAQPALAAPSAIDSRASKSSGCGSKSSWDFNDNNHHMHHTTVAGNKRKYLVHLPDDYDADSSSPVVLSFHGVAGNSFGQEGDSQLSYHRQRLADKGIIAVYPQGLDGKGGGASWDGAPYAESDADDIDFVHAILDELSDNLCVDTSRIYASGFSNGGGFTHLLACTPSINKRVAAFGMASGAYYPASHPGSKCDPGRKVPVLLTHGDGDPTVHFQGENPKTKTNLHNLPFISDFAKDWAERNGHERDSYDCSRLNGDDDVHLWTWGNDGDAGQVRRYRVLGMTHMWPSRPHNAPFNLSEEVLLPFFGQYTL